MSKVIGISVFVLFLRNPAYRWVPWLSAVRTQRGKAVNKRVHISWCHRCVSELLGGTTDVRREHCWLSRLIIQPWHHCTAAFPNHWCLWLDIESDVRRRPIETDRRRKGCLSYLREGFSSEGKVQDDAGSNQCAHVCGTSVGSQNRWAGP